MVFFLKKKVPDFDLEPEPTEIVFLVDCSGMFD